MSNLSQLIGDFDPSEIEDAPQFSELTPGYYYATVEKADAIAANGEVFCEIQYDVFRTIDGEEVKGKVWDSFAMKHPKENRQKWGRIFWKQFVEAILGKGSVENETDLYLGKILQIKIEYSPNAKDPSKPYKNVKGRWAKDHDLSEEVAAMPEKTEAAPPTAATPDTPAKKKNPWD